MEADVRRSLSLKPVHGWLRDLDVSFVKGPGTRLTARVAESLLEAFRRAGHRVQPAPDGDTDVILTTALFGEPLNWRKALLFTARRRFGLEHAPTIYTLVGSSREPFEQALDHLRAVLPKSPPVPGDYAFPGLAEQAYRVLFEQGQRGGPILALERVVQSQAKCIDVLLVVGDHTPEEAFLFNLVGAHPRISADPPERFYTDIVRRIVTAESTQGATDHSPVGDPIPYDVWKRLQTPRAMCGAGRELGRRGFFTDMVRIAELVNVPAVASAVSSQYSEGCFSTWDPTLDALVVTVTGSARPVYKGAITEEDLAVVTGLKSDGSGALVRHIEGRSNAPPSSEAVEMLKIDESLPTIALPRERVSPAEVPVARSKLHGHRGCARYDPQWVEYVSMAPAYHHYPVTCATAAQARGIADAFSRSEALRDLDDPRQVVFTVLPGHGIVVVERWVAGTVPFQMIWEAMDKGWLEIARHVPQGPIEYALARGGLRLVRGQA
jgi:hypothetical protein